VDPPRRIRARQTRSLLTSWAEMSGVDPNMICRAATWASTCTFARRYRLNMAHRRHADFGRRVLRVTGSSEASSDALRDYKVPEKPEVIPIVNPVTLLPPSNALLKKKKKRGNLTEHWDMRSSVLD